jgi:4-diphosphocytidyl-2-C-methyl-D-erythritol kinase
MFSQAHITWLPSPAKINLFLHICGRYDNGYHKIQSLFQILDYGDEIGLRLSDVRNQSDDIRLINNIDGVATTDNLIYRAAHALLPYRTNHYGIEISLRKILPMGGGIGGGSSNAATVLIALNTAWQCELTIDKLAQLGLTLGADVPVFVRGRSAFAQGIGEQLVPVMLPLQYYLVATPDVHISTAAVFSDPDLPRNTPPLKVSDYHFDTSHNDCEILVTKAYSKVANLLQWLLHYAPSRMTGTGASVFAVFASEADAQKVLHKLPKGIKGFVAKGVDRSPLHDFFEKNGLGNQS